MEVKRKPLLSLKDTKLCHRATGNAFQLRILIHLRPQTVQNLDSLNYIADQRFICWKIASETISIFCLINPAPSSCSTNLEMGLLKQLAIYPSAISTGTSCHQGKNTHGHRVALAQPLALTAVVSPSIQARWRVVRGMRRLQSAGAVCCLAISAGSRCGSALSVTCDLWQCQH